MVCRKTAPRGPRLAYRGHVCCHDTVAVLGLPAGLGNNRSVCHQELPLRRERRAAHGGEPREPQVVGRHLRLTSLPAQLSLSPFITHAAKRSQLFNCPSDVKVVRRTVRHPDHHNQSNTLKHNGRATIGISSSILGRHRGISRDSESP